MLVLKVQDQDQPLSDQGVSQVLEMARAMQNCDFELPNNIYHSSELAAMQTAMTISDIGSGRERPPPTLEVDHVHVQVQRFISVQVQWLTVESATSQIEAEIRVAIGNWPQCS